MAVSVESHAGPLNPVPHSDKTAEQLDAESFAEERKVTTRLAAGIGFGLALFTLYFGFVNAWKLAHAEPQPFRLKLESPRGPTPHAAYRASLVWQPMAGKETPVRPVVTVNGFPVAGRQATIATGQPVEVRIVVPPSATPGEHFGRLVLERAEGPGSLPQTLLVPVRVQVTGGWWSSWAILRNWLILAVLAWACWYVICLLAFPGPSGELAVRRIATGADVTHHVPLGPSPARILRPWTRSTVDLNWIWKNANVPRIPLGGRIEFMAPGLPQLWLLARGGITISCLGPAARPEPGVQYPAAGPVELMGQRHWMIKVVNPVQTVIIQYRQNRSWPGAQRQGTR